MRISVTELGGASEVLRKGDRILLTGYVYTARDAAHKRMFELLDRGESLPFDLNGAIIYYAGPTEKPDNLPIGSCGPTTSGRMDSFTPRLHDMGLSATIGKGERSREVMESIKRNKAVYFAAVGGAGALAAICVKSLEVIAFPELGCESIKKLYVEDFPLVVAIDASGDSVYVNNIQNYIRKNDDFCRFV